MAKMDKALRNWSWRMEFTEDHSFLMKSHLDVLLQMMTIRLCPSLLKAAIQCWNPTTHVFRFGSAELCPTIEEFRACLISPPKGMMFRPSPKKDYKQEIRNFFGWNEEEVSMFVQGQRLKLRPMIEAYARPEPEDDEAKARRRRVYLYCIIARTLLQSQEGTGSPIIIDLIRHAEGKRDIVPTILAETLRGLDLAANLKGRCRLEKFNGSLYLLQIWLVERLGLVEELGTSSLDRYQMVKRADPTTYQVNTDWPSRLKQMTISSIRWKCSWWNAEKVVTNTPGSTDVQIMGLTHTSFYSPAKLVHQFGMLRNIGEMGTSCEAPKELDLEMVKAIASGWDQRTLLRVL